MEKGEILVENAEDVKRVVDSIVAAEYMYYENCCADELYEDGIEDLKSSILNELDSTAKYKRALIYDKEENVFRWGYDSACARECWTIWVEENFELDQIDLF